MQVSEADIEPVESLPHLADLQQAALPAAELKVGRRGEGGEGAVVALLAPAPTPKTSPPTPFPQALLAKTAVLKLNGGLGTSMGLEKAKSLLPVKGGKSFLDLIAEQVNRERGAVWGVGEVDGVRRLARGARARRPHLPHPSSHSQIKHTRTATGSHVRFILMDSFSTSADTRAALAATHPELIDPATPDWELLQNASPKLDATTLEPVAFPADPELEWCPPGHGDIYAALSGSGMLDRLIGAEEGWESVWERGGENAGAMPAPPRRPFPPLPSSPASLSRRRRPPLRLQLGQPGRHPGHDPAGARGGVGRGVRHGGRRAHRRGQKGGAPRARQGGRPDAARVGAVRGRGQGRV